MNRIVPLYPSTPHRAVLPLVTAEQQEQLMRAMEDVVYGVDDEPPTAPSQVEALDIIVPFLESLREQDADDVPLPALALLALMAMYPVVPEHVGVQLAFGPDIAAMNVDDLRRLRARARRCGLSVDELVARSGPEGAVPTSEFGDFFLGQLRRGPDPERMRRGIALLRRILSLLPSPLRPHLLCSLAWLHWAQGETDVALAFLAQASGEDHDHVLARSLAVYFARVSPAWLA